MKNKKTIILILIILLSVGTALLFSREENQKKLVHLIHSFDKSEKEFKISKSYEKENIQYLNGRFLEWDGEKLTVLDGSQKVLWTKTFLFENPKLVLEDNRIAVYDQESGMLYLYNGNGETLLEHDFEEPIFNIKVWDQGLIAHFKLEDKEKLHYYNLKRDNWQEVNFIDSYPLDYWIDHSDNLIYSQIEFKEDHLTSSLYKKSSDKADLIVDLKDNLILKALPYRKGYVILTDTGIVSISKGKEKLSRDYDLVNDILVDGEEIYILYGDNLEVLNKSLETIHKKTYALSYTKLHGHEKYILLYGEKNIVALFNKEDRAVHAFGSSIKSVKSQFNNLVITLRTGVYTMRIENAEKEK